mmetsp:Transcript_11391/g.30562  ORF Transcript_11391/g.30562 Transcript_11391/m.30562 type:complete len:217 (-) Transcript_11391:1518-2168(-)
MKFCLGRGEQILERPRHLAEGGRSKAQGRVPQPVTPRGVCTKLEQHPGGRHIAALSCLVQRRGESASGKESYHRPKLAAAGFEDSGGRDSASLECAPEQHRWSSHPIRAAPSLEQQSHCVGVGIVLRTKAIHRSITATSPCAESGLGPRCEEEAQSGCGRARQEACMGGCRLACKCVQLFKGRLPTYFQHGRDDLGDASRSREVKHAYPAVVCCSP